MLQLVVTVHQAVTKLKKKEDIRKKGRERQREMREVREEREKESERERKIERSREREREGGGGGRGRRSNEIIMCPQIQMLHSFTMHNAGIHVLHYVSPYLKCSNNKTLEVS